MKRNVDVAVMMPCYPQIKHLLTPEQKQVDLTLHLGGQHYLYQVHRLELDGVSIYTIDYPKYFDRERPYDDGQNAYGDNGERFAFFCLAALQATQMLMIQPDIIHCNDWHTALTPFFLKTLLADNRYFAHSKTVLTVHNGAYQGNFDLNSIHFAHTFSQYTHDNMYDGYNQINFLKCGVLYADAINAVSPSYARELLTPLGGHGMSHIYLQRKEALYGILNGCDYSAWDPNKDPLLPAHFTADDLTGKATCKADLQEQFHLPVEADTPLFAMVSRFTEQKGFSLLLPALEDFLEGHKAQVVIVGSGDREVSQSLERLAQRYPQQMAVFIGYSDALSHQTQAGSDFFLMPSIFEPCGLTQMYSLAYGSLPIVREVGGLKDTVLGYHDDNYLSANGISFLYPNAESMYNALHSAQELYSNEHDKYLVMQQNAMASRFGWEQSTQSYLTMYDELMPT